MPSDALTPPCPFCEASSGALKGRSIESSVIEENTQCKCIKIADGIKQKRICTVSKNEESLLGKINLVIREWIVILNYFFNQKLESLSRRAEEVQGKETHEETAISFLKKLSKPERQMEAAKAFQEEMSSKMAVHQTMLPSVYYPNTVGNQLAPSAFCRKIINIPTNTFLLSPYTGFPSAQVSEYTSSDGPLLFPVETQNSTIEDNLAIPINVHTSRNVSSSSGRTNRSLQIPIKPPEFKTSVNQSRVPKAERRNNK